MRRICSPRSSVSYAYLTPASDFTKPSILAGDDLGHFLRLHPSARSTNELLSGKRCSVQSVYSRGEHFFSPGGRRDMTDFLRRMWGQDEGQDIAEYAVMLAVILVIVVGTIRLIGSNSNNVFSSVASSIGS